MTRAVADMEHLSSLYAETDDPWSFRTSAYEAERIAAVTACLPQRRYRSALELGCGNGELAQRIAQRCDAYTGLDAVPTALKAARRVMPRGRFVEAFLPCDLPRPVGRKTYDLILLSEILYFLDRAAIRDIASQVDRDHPDADVVTATWRGPTGHALSGEQALAAFAAGTPRHGRTARLLPGCRIAVFAPLTAVG